MMRRSAWGAFGCLLCCLSCHVDKTDAGQDEDGGAEREPVHFVVAQKATKLSALSLMGEVVVPDDTQQQFGPAVAARLTRWMVSPGERVEEGAELARLSSPELSDLVSLATEVGQLVAERQKNRDRVEMARKAGFASAADLADAELALSTAEGQRERVRAQLHGRDQYLERSSGNEWRWLCPSSGLVAQVRCAPGGLLDAETRCVDIVTDDGPRVRVAVSEALVGRLQDERPQASWKPRGAGKEQPLVFERKDRSIDPQSRSYAFYFRGEDLVLGASGQVELSISPPQGAVVVPRLAVVSVQGQDTVFVKNADETVRPVSVRVLGREGEYLLIGGVAAGTEVVGEGAFSLKSILAFE